VIGGWGLPVVLAVDQSQGSRCRVQSLGFKVQGLRFRVQGLGSKVQG